MSDPLRIGFLGCGLIASSHARNLAASPDAAVVAVYDLDQDRARAFADRFGRPGTTVVVSSPEAVVAASDAVYVCTWTSAHPELVELVVGAGRALFCEKPLAVDLAAAEAMTAEVERSGVVNQVGLVLRNSPSFRWLHQRVTAPEAGRIMNIVFRDDQYLPIQGLYGSTWRADRTKAGAGALLEHSIHDLDLLRWLMGPITRVSAAIGFRPGMDGIDDQASVLLEARSGAQAVLASVWHDVLSRPSQRRVEVLCQAGVFTLAGDWLGPVSAEMAAAAPAARTDPAPPESLGGDDLVAAAARGDGLGANADAAFVAAVRDGRPAYPDLTVALEAHRLADAAYRSAAEGGRPVAVG